MYNKSVSDKRKFWDVTIGKCEVCEENARQTEYYKRLAIDLMQAVKNTLPGILAAGLLSPDVDAGEWAQLAEAIKKVEQL